MPNPTFNPIAKPGAFHARLKELQEGKGDAHLSDFAPVAYGQLESAPRGVPAPRRSPHGDGRAGRRAVLPVPDAG